MKQGRDTLVRDLFALREIQRGELGHPLDNAITPSSVI